MLEAHYGVPMAGAVLNALNYRLDGRTIAFILQHGGAKRLITDAEFSDTVARRSVSCRARFRSWTSSGRMATVTSIG
jgi:fatty-acyl-CoA synthase